MAHQENLFVVKHEVTHQIMGPWNRHLPAWLKEGLAECIAATPYVRGRYSFTSFDSGMRDYVLKWRKTKDQRNLRLIPPAKLMSLSDDDWQAQVDALTAYDYYNSAALLTFWFLHYDGAGDGAGLADFFGALPQRRMQSSEAMERFVLRGRKPEKIEADLRTMCRRLALQVDPS